MGYHLTKIKKGKKGKFSKIVEEFEELKDAHKQNNIILEICEICDLIGAIELYIENHDFTLDDIIKMKNLTRSAFEDGSRK